MMKLLRLRNGSFLFVVCCLLGCKDKQELGFLGDIEVGKYEITQYREYPNGSKDTLKWEAYGPWNQKGAGRYYFQLHEETIFRSFWEITEDRVTYGSESTLDYLTRGYYGEIVEKGNDIVKINFEYFINNNGLQTDSANGQIIFKRISQ